VSLTAARQPGFWLPPMDIYRWVNEVDRMKRKFQHSHVARITIILLGIWTIGLLGCGGGSQSKLPYDMELANQGYEELLKKNYEKAEAFYEVALSVNPLNPYALLNLGVIYHNTGRIEQAKKMYRKVIEINSDQTAIKSTSGNHVGKRLSDIAKMNLRSLEE
jgi:tetratricopeptide (TPR) repeat protein